MNDIHRGPVRFMQNNMVEVHDSEAAAARLRKFLTFILGDVAYGLDIQNVTEILGIQPTIVIPDVPPHVRGVINLRGKVIPVMDVRLRFNLKAREDDEKTCIIVVESGERKVGLIVDMVSDVLDIATEHIDPPPNIGDESTKRCISGLGKVGRDVKVLLNVHQLLAFDDDDQPGTNGHNGANGTNGHGTAPLDN